MASLGVKLRRTCAWATSPRIVFWLGFSAAALAIAASFLLCFLSISGTCSQIRLTTSLTATDIAGAASLWSIAAHTYLSPEPLVRRIARRTTFLTLCLLCVAHAKGIGMLYPSALLTFVQDYAVILMFFTILAECSGSMTWTGAQAALGLLVGWREYQANPEFRGGVPFRLASLAARGTSQLWFLLYFAISGALRFGALQACGAARLFGPEERRWLRWLACFHVAAFLTSAAEPIVFARSRPASHFLDWAIVEVAYATTPMALVNFLSLSHTRVQEVQAQLERAKQARVAADAAAQARAGFVQYVFHEVRVPFNALVLGLRDMAAVISPLGQPRLAEDLELLESAAASMRLLLDGTLDAEAMASGAFRVHQRATDLRAALAYAAKLMRPCARDVHASIELDVDPTVPRTLEADGPRLCQACANLISNALKFVPQDGSGAVHVSASLLAPPLAHSGGGQQAPPSSEVGGPYRAWVRIQVRDNGCGMSAADQARLFRAFQQVGDRDAHCLGTGLGLYICHEIVRQHGGRISVDSAPHEGAVFSIDLPLTVLPTPAQAEPSVDGGARARAGTAAEPAVTAAEPAGTGAVLIVDDSKSTRLLLRRALQLQLPHTTVEEAASGREAIAAVRSDVHRFAAVCLDKDMAELSGLATAEKLRELGYAGAIFAVTGDDAPETAAAFARVGGEAVFTKPVDTAGLASALNRVLLRDATDGGL
jgi:signal transduction histidine kinase/ActR/RegA family two-component response regulator